MPFTPTHIVAVLPISFVCKRLSLVALSIGAITPDFTMFFPISTYRFSHSPVGLIVYCVPTGLILYYLFEKIGKQFLIDICPLWIGSRLGQYRNNTAQYNLVNIVCLSIAIVIGSTTHIIWDAFTHKTGWGLQLIPQLTVKLSVFGYQVPGYKVVQYGSTLIGLSVLILLGVFFLYRITPGKTVSSYKFSKFMVWTILTSFLGIPCIFMNYYLQYKSSIYSVIGATAIKSIPVSIVLFFSYSFIYWRRSLRYVET